MKKILLSVLLVVVAVLLITVADGFGMWLLVNVLLHNLFGVAKLSFLACVGYGFLLSVVTSIFFPKKNQDKN